jgi:hypothetical protein
MSPTRPARLEPLDGPVTCASPPGWAAVVVLGVAAAALTSRSYSTGVSWAVVSRFAGLTLAVAALLVLLWPSTRALVSDLGRAARAAVSPGERWHLVALIAIVGIGIWVRARFAGQSMRFDEASTYFSFAVPPVDQGLAQYPIPGNHLFHSFLQHLSHRLFGDGLLAVRLPALVAGIALVPAVYAAARSLYDRESGLVAAALTAVSAPLVEYSVNARGYTLVCLTVVALVPITVYALDRRSPAAGVIWAAVAAVGTYTIPVTAYGVAIVAGWALLSVLLDQPPGRRLVAAAWGENVLLAAALGAYLLYRPVIGDAGWDYNEAQVPGRFVRLIYDTFHVGWPGALEVVLAVGVIGAVGLHLRAARHRAPLWLAMLVVIPVTVELSTRVPPFVRSWLFVLPLYLVVASAGLVALGRLALQRAPSALSRGAAAAAVLTALGLGLALSDTDLPNGEDPPVRDADVVTRYLKREFQPGDGLIVGRFSQPAFTYHFQQAGFNPGAMGVGPVAMTVPAAAGHRTLYLDSLTRGPGPPDRAIGATGARVIKRFRWIVVYEIPPAPPA